MDTDVTAAEVLALLSDRVGALVTEIDTYRVMVRKLQDYNEALGAKVLSCANTIQGLEDQVASLGAWPMSQPVAEAPQREHPDE
jgi:hypothetical protein